MTTRKISTEYKTNVFLIAAMTAVMFVALPASAQHRAVQLTPGLLTYFTDFGKTVSTAGDVNNDTYVDIIVSQPNSRKIYIYYGSENGQFTPTTGSVAIPDWQFTSSASNFGSALATGDFNCDNIDDIVVGAHSAGSLNEGQVYVFYGSDTTGLSATPDWQAESDTTWGWLGWSVASAGDINKDGCNDLLVGGRRSGNGMAVLFFGGAAGLPDADADGVAHLSDFSWSATSISGDLGQSVAGVGDVNNDGVDDILIGSRNGNIYLYYGADGGTPSTSADWSDSRGNTFGNSVARAGDVNNDGIPDFIVGEPWSSSGVIHLYYGNTGGPRMDGSADWSYTPANEAHSHGNTYSFASAISGGSDFNNDGHDDILVGWGYYHGGQTDHIGRVYIFDGGISGPSLGPSQTIDGLQEGAQFGSSVSATGDIDGDLIDDFIVGARLHTTVLSPAGSSMQGTGAAFAYLSSTAQAHIRIDPPQSYISFHVTSEDGISDTSSFNVVLDAAPSANVTVNITSNDPTEGAVSPAVLTFTSGNWNVPQTISITGVDDALEDGAVSYTISIFATSTDLGYDSLITDDVTVLNTDDDAVGVVIDPTSDLITTEDLGTATFTIRLDAQPIDDVSINLSSSNVQEGTVSPAIVTFNTSNFRNAQLVTITGIDDAVIDGNIPYTIVTAPAVSADNRYNNFNAIDVSVTNYDNDLQLSVNVLEGDQTGSLFGRTVSRAGDINGDGFDDFIIGAPKHDNGLTNEGRAYVYFGAPTGFTATPWTAEFSQNRAEFGWSVASAGDVNGDGFSDIIIGARKYDGGETDEGRVFVYYGSASGLPATPDWMAEIDQAGANFGAAVSSAGDVNGDGYDDILVGADNYYAADFVDPSASYPQFVKEGAAFLYYGSANGLPDADSDGIAHLIDVGWQGQTGGSNAFSSANYGQAIGSGGDVNCDGFADIIVGAPKYSLRSTSGLWGRVWIYYGGLTGPRNDGNADWTVLGDQESTSFGSSVASAGNVNGDTNGGYSCDDVLVGADSYESGVNENNEGKIYLYDGSPTGLATTPSWSHENNQADSKLGVSSAMAGDINDDGYADIIVGANRYDRGETDEGRLFIYFGSASGLGNPLTREINQASAYFGTAVAGTGDVDGDGRDDILVGATLYDGDLPNEGAAFLYLSDKAAIKAFPSSGLMTTEAGGSANFSVVLTDAPSANVIITLSGDPTEGALSVSSLVFTSSNWFTPQSVTVTGLNDADVDGNVPYLITTTAASTDSRYNGMNTDGVTVTNLDDEKPVVAITASDAIADESGPDTGTFTVSRTGGSPSPLMLFYTVSGTATNGIDYQSLGGSVTIAAGSSSAVITVTPLLDGVSEANETVILTLSPDVAYTVGVSSSNISISDSTVPGITVSPTSGLVTTEQGGSDTFSVVLASQPSADVTVNLSSDTSGEGTPLVASLTFTTANWDMPQTATVVGQDDAAVDGDRLYTIVTTVSSSDGNYSVLNPADVSVTNRDDDALSVVSIVTRTKSISEGGSVVFRVSRTDSTSNLVVNYSVSGTATSGIDYVTPTGSVTIFNGQGWRDINVNSLSDFDPEGEETVIITLTDNAAYIVGSPRADSATIRNIAATTSLPINFGPDQVVAEGTTISVPVIRPEINSYVNITVTYTVSGSAVNPDDHNAMAGSIVIPWQQSSANITFDTVADALTEVDETIIFTIQSFSAPAGNPIYHQGVLGSKTTHTVTITEANLEPATYLTASQGGSQTHLVVTGNGNVTLTADVADPNSGDNHSYDWSLTNNSLVDDNLDGDPATFVFDPSGLTPGFYKAHITVTDDGGPILAVANELLFEVVATAPTLGFSDSDGDSLNDSTESYDDSDGDGIADYLDPNNFNSQGMYLTLNALQQIPMQYQSYVMRTDPGLALRLGDIAFAAGSDSAQVSVDDIANFGDGEGGAGTATAQDIIPNIGGYFDFEIANLPVAGTSASVVIPQFEALPSGARYRKYHPINGWNDFVEDANNSLASAPGIPGMCPMPGDAAYTSGLTPGDFCVQLTIEDGGPNDTDGIANHVIEDPGQIGIVELPATPINGGSQTKDSSTGGGTISLVAILGLLSLFTGITLRRRRLLSGSRLSS